MKAAEKLAVHELLARAAAALDEHALDDLRRCFTKDARFTLEIAGQGVVGPFEGRDAVMGLISDAVATQTDQRRHVVSNIWFEREGRDRAKVASNLTLLSTENGALRLVCTGVYRDTVVRGKKGWRLKDRFLYLDMPY